MSERMSATTHSRSLPRGYSGDVDSYMVGCALQFPIFRAHLRIMWEGFADVLLLIAYKSAIPCLAEVQLTKITCCRWAP